MKPTTFLVPVRTTLLLLLALWLTSLAASAQGPTAFTYQGRLTDAGQPATGSYDLQFTLYDAASNGAILAGPLTIEDLAVTGGVFTTSLDFGSNVFTAAGERFLEIAVRPGADTGSFTPLAPRQRLTATPYAVRSLTADIATSAITAQAATNATQLGGVAAGQFVQTGDTRLSDARNPLPGSSDYIQNNSTPQIANFSVTGTGSVGGNFSAFRVNSSTEYTIGGQPILVPSGNANLRVGFNTGASIILGSGNSFFGNRSGNQTSFGNNNSFFGRQSGITNTEGSDNTFIGANTAPGSTTGNRNTFVGSGSGFANTTGSDNTFIGFNAGSGTEQNLTNATAIGANAQVTTSNTIVLGRNGGGDQVVIPGPINGITFSSLGIQNLLIGNGFRTPTLNTSADNMFFGNNVGPNTTSGSRNTFVGNGSGFSNTVGSNNTFIGFNAGSGGLSNLTFATAIGADAQVSTSNTVVLGRSVDQVRIPGNLQVSGTVGGGLNVAGTVTATTFTGTSLVSGASINSNSTYSIANQAVMGQIRDNFFIGGGTPGALSASTGRSNLLVGASAGPGLTTGSDNALFGKFSGSNLTTGNENTFVGNGSGFSNSTGSHNTFIGFNAGSGSLSNLTYATVIGADAQVSTSNTIQLGRESGADQIVAPGPFNFFNNTLMVDQATGNVGIGLSNPAQKLHVNGIVRALNFTTTSDERFKTDIRTITGGLDLVLKLRGVTFFWKPEFLRTANAPNIRNFGFIAQEVEKVMPELVFTGPDGTKSVAYASLVPALVEATKEQQTRIETQQKEIEALQRQIDELKAIVRAMKPQTEGSDRR